MVSTPEIAVLTQSADLLGAVVLRVLWAVVAGVLGARKGYDWRLSAASGLLLSWVGPSALFLLPRRTELAALVAPRATKPASDDFARAA
jgi:hypothetical protein